MSKVNYIAGKEEEGRELLSKRWAQSYTSIYKVIDETEKLKAAYDVYESFAKNQRKPILEIAAEHIFDKPSSKLKEEEILSSEEFKYVLKRINSDA